MRGSEHKPHAEVLLDALREEAARQHSLGRTWTSMCEEIGWWSSAGADTSRLKRTLGLMPWQSGGGIAKSMSREQALLMCRALRVDPVDFGL
jgi:hypothetical protein